MEIDPLIGDKIERRWRKSDDGRVQVEDQEEDKNVEINWECSDTDVFDGQPCIFGNLVDKGVESDRSSSQCRKATNNKSKHCGRVRRNGSVNLGRLPPATSHAL
jgi:hypothetical protein